MLQPNVACRPHSPGDYVALKLAVKEATKLAGPIASIAARTRLDAGTISRAGNPRESNFLPLDVAIDIDALAGEPIILTAMARLCGYELVPLNVAHVTECLSLQAGHAAREAGELVAHAIEASQDKAITPAEAQRIDTEAAEVERVVSAIRRHMCGVIAAGK